MKRSLLVAVMVGLGWAGSSGAQTEPPPLPEGSEPTPTQPGTQPAPNPTPGGYPPDSYPPGSYPPGSYPPGSYPPGSYPPGSYPPGSYPPGSYPPGSYPPGSYPPGSYPPPGAYPPPAGYPGAYPGAYPGYPAYGYPPPPPKEETPKNADARADDGVAISGGGFLYNLVGVGIGMQLGFYAQPDTIIEADFLVGATLIPDVTSIGSASISVRQFVTSTFSMRGGVRYRDIRTQDYWLGFDDEWDEYIESTDIGFDFSLGNRWQIGGFMIGADWIGFYAPVATLDAEGVLENEDTGEKTRTDVDEDQVDRQYDVRLVYFMLGGSF